MLKYSAERVAKLGEQAAAKNSPFSLSDRMGLISDSLTLARAGYAPVSSNLDLVKALRDEKEREQSIGPVVYPMDD